MFKPSDIIPVLETFIENEYKFKTHEEELDNIIAYTKFLHNNIFRYQDIYQGQTGQRVQKIRYPENSTIGAKNNYYTENLYVLYPDIYVDGINTAPIFRVNLYVHDTLVHLKDYVPKHAVTIYKFFKWHDSLQGADKAKLDTIYKVFNDHFKSPIYPTYEAKSLIEMLREYQNKYLHLYENVYLYLMSYGIDLWDYDVDLLVNRPTVHPLVQLDGALPLPPSFRFPVSPKTTGIGTLKEMGNETWMGTPGTNERPPFRDWDQNPDGSSNQMKIVKYQQYVGLEVLESIMKKWE